MTARYYEAKKAYVQTLEKDPANSTVKNNLSEIYFIEKKYAQALELCSEILSVNSRELNALRRRAYCYDALGKSAEAEMDFKLAVELNPTSENLASFGLFYFRQHEYRKAIDQFVQAEKTSSNPVVLYRYLGEANWRLREYKAMATWYEKLVQSHPDNLLGWKNLALAYEALGQKELLAQARNQINKISSTN
jgi:tetratricopeptide (TPR) repeat protein